MRAHEGVFVELAFSLVPQDHVLNGQGDVGEAVAVEVVCEDQSQVSHAHEGLGVVEGEGSLPVHYAKVGSIEDAGQVQSLRILLVAPGNTEGAFHNPAVVRVGFGYVEKDIESGLGAAAIVYGEIGLMEFNFINVIALIFGFA